MKPATHTLRELFGADVRYVVPLYQRPYVWRKASHWEPLWQDVVLILDRHLEASVTRGHFLGAVVLELESTSPGEIVRRLVIDGQQRLTTLQLLVSAAATEVELAGGEKPARLLTRLVRNNPDMAEGNEQLKIWPTNADRDAFSCVMAGVPFTGDSTIPKAHEYFHEVIRSWLNAAPVGQRPERCDAVRVVLTELLHVVSINLEPGDDAQVIFETLNARGTPLLAIDLVKNAVFQRLEQDHPHGTDKLHHEVWEPELGRSLWREEVRQGRLKRPRAELFLMHWLAMKLGEIIGAGELFSTFRDRILNADDVAADQLITELCADAKIMQSFDEFPVASVEGRFFQRLAVLDTTTVLPALLLLFRDPRIDIERRRDALAALESWLVRRMVCGLSTNGYTNAFTEVLATARGSGEPIDRLLIQRLDSWEAPANRWPRDNEVAQVFATRGLYGWIAQRRLVMVLAGVEARRRESSKVESILDPEASLSLEHLMPQSWREHWPLPQSEDAELAAAERDRRLNLIGNLTLVTAPLNSSLSNSSWPVKRSAIANHSLLLLNRELTALETWHDTAIDGRCELLASEVCAVWRSPPTDRAVPSALAVSTPRRRYSWTLADLIAAEKLVPGEWLRPAPAKYATLAQVIADGTLEVEGEVFTSPSGAATRVSGNKADPGWEFWTTERNGAQVKLMVLRDEMGVSDA